MGNFLLSGGEFCLGAWAKMKKLVFWLINISSNNLNTWNSKPFLNRGGIYRFGKKVNKYSGEINPLIAHLGVIVLEVEESFMQSLSILLLIFADKNNS